MFFNGYYKFLKSKNVILKMLGKTILVIPFKCINSIKYHNRIIYIFTLFLYLIICSNTIISSMMLKISSLCKKKNN